MFWKKVEDLLAKVLKKKDFKIPVEECIRMADSFARRKTTNIELWQPILNDLDNSINFGGLSNNDIYFVIRSLYAVNLLDDEMTKKLVEYLVKRGYDSDDLLNLSTAGTSHRKAVHFIWLIADNCPKLKNKHFLTHVSIFAQQAMQELSTLQKVRLYDALKKL